MKIEGIPEGWELVRIGRANLGEHYLTQSGKIVLWDIEEQSDRIYPIIRKKPKQYRPFQNRTEAEPLFDCRVKYKDADSAVFRVVALGGTGAQIGLGLYLYDEAFRLFECSDGTPFGIEVTE